MKGSENVIGKWTGTAREAKDAVPRKCCAECGRLGWGQLGRCTGCSGLPLGGQLDTLGRGQEVCSDVKNLANRSTKEVRVEGSAAPSPSTAHPGNGFARTFPHVCMVRPSLKAKATCSTSCLCGVVRLAA